MDGESPMWRQCSCSSSSIFCFAALITYSGWTPLNTPLQVQEHLAPLRQMKRAMVADAIAHKGVTREAFELSFNSSANSNSKTWVFVMIPAFAACLAAVYGFRRYFFAHLVFATHFYGFVLLYFLVSAYGLGLFATVAARSGFRVSALTLDRVSVVGLLIFGFYLFVAFRRTYDDRVLAASLRAAAMTVAFVPVLFGYRLLLFFVTMRTMH